MDKIFGLPLHDFLDYIKTIRYGYRDIYGAIHTEENDNFDQYPYSFSGPKAVIENNCAWCWDICGLLRCYCEQNTIPVSTWFYEYQDETIHQTHTQTFIQLDQLWFPVPDNSDPHDFSEFQGKSFSAITKDFQQYFKEYIRYLVKEKENTKAYFFREYTEIPQDGMTDKEVLQVLRGR